VASTTIDSSKVELMEAEQQALADQALTEFAASYGLEMPAAPRAAPAAEGASEARPPQKDMGPAAKQGE
jgi:hypothetical protein